jgi:acyl carrier protein
MPIDPARLRDVVREATANAVNVSPDELDGSVNLLAIGLDSLNFATILIDIEDGIGAEVPAEILDRFLELGDVVTLDHVIRLLSAWDPDRPPERHAYPRTIVVQGR